MCSNLGPILQTQILTECRKYIKKNKSFLQTPQQILNAHNTEPPWAKRIQVCFNEGQRCLLGDDNEIAKIHLWNSKHIFSWIPWSITTKFGATHQIRICSNQRQSLFTREIMFLRNSEDTLTEWKKNDLLKKNLADFNELGITHCLVKGFKLIQRMGHAFWREIITKYRKYILKYPSPWPQGQFEPNLCEVSAQKEPFQFLNQG